MQIKGCIPLKINNMSKKTKNIIVTLLLALIAIIFLGSAIGKISGSEQMMKMATGFGFSEMDFKVLGLIEIVGIALFIFPRTGVLGALLLTAYMGGGIATHLQHGQTILIPVLIECLIWITAAIRFPELLVQLTYRTDKAL
ncbi:DoxX family protein [Mucilaginibacter gilvus]|uniref:DoxX family protein n=1 Tax=Mucilaginibacter gilvus TaxID=2305909 RepID=A0A3S3WZT3_9SPHI|nr:DoxX family protein [Mucilaginibacter gilvus]RWY47372.1 DoxX family protein [Mucilaginibacter gilvus]